MARRRRLIGPRESPADDSAARPGAAVLRGRAAVKAQRALPQREMAERGGGGHALSGREAAAMPASENGAARAIGWRQLYRWFAPWIGGLLLVLAALLGLFTAAGAQDTTDAAGGYTLCALALVALARGIKACGDGTGRGIWSPFLVEDGDTLLLLAVLQSGLAVGGLLLAARAGDALWQYSGCAMFLASIAIIGGNLKHYFDRCDRRARQGVP
jgi:hypothetical protein